MITVILTWPDGQWAVRIGLTQQQLAEIENGNWLTYVLRPTKMPGGPIFEPLLVTILQAEAYEAEAFQTQLKLRTAAAYPDETHAMPILLSAKAREQLVQQQHLTMPFTPHLQNAMPSGWGHCKFTELCYGDTEAELCMFMRIDPQPISFRQYHKQKPLPPGSRAGDELT